MKIRKVDANNDWKFGKGLSSYATEEAAVEENIKTRLLSWQGDCFFALDEGVDYSNLLGKGRKADLLQAIQAVILASEGVVRVNNVEATLDANRKLTVTYSIDTIYNRNFKSKVQE